ncbi:FecR domain-containing protein [Caballeronia sp. NK8]|uniref:FecR domain-containing protein n=1 Tax=Caballeronia sp. NK8 TaxID=140098 RepID=UPI001BB6BE3C|nr:FecR domain-containing protein [Caballeronia sp. NK8]BCQ26384.1 FecR domain-containing protein [Caballeronia sp. NK8]
MNARTLLHTIRLSVALACLCALHGAHAGQAMLLPEGTVTLIRATTVFNVDAPIALQPGDLLATDAIGGAQIEDGDGTIVALGANTRVAIDAAPHGDALALLSGWIKIARPRTGTAGPLSIDTPALDASLLDGAAVLHASRDMTSLFIETGSMTLALPEHADAHQQLDGEHYAERETGKPLDVGKRPATSFIAAMPLPFRDPLASSAAPAKAKLVAPVQGRAATYADIADWLSAPLAIRRGFVARFRPLAQGEPFRAQVRQNLRNLPEWRRVLCPPPAMPRRRAVSPVQNPSTEVES